MEQRKKESGIRLEDVAAGYGRKSLLNHISLHVSPGNVLTLIGPNGAGKSTILKTVTRQLAELGGTIFLEGTSMSRMREEEVARTLAMVMTERLHPEFMTCREVVATGRYPYTGRLGILSAEDWKLVDDAMQLVHARDTADRNFSQISDGQRQRVMLARAICQEPRILILDEPTSYLDMRYKIDILSSIRRLAAERNMAVVMSLHELDLAPLMLFDERADFLRMGIAAYRISFTIEEEEQAAFILDLFERTFLSGKHSVKELFPDGYTRGHYKRGVE